MRLDYFMTDGRLDLDRLRGEITIDCEGWDDDVGRALLDHLTRLNDAAEYLWTVVANASGGNWDLQSAEWQAAAAKARDQYFACPRLTRTEGT